MKKILAFGASNSKNSINKSLARFTANKVMHAEVILPDLNDFEMPIYGIDIERSSGIPEPAYRFKDLIREADGIVISFAEHNGLYTVAFKNIFDWVSRIDRDMWLGKPMFLLSTAPGPRGGKRVLENALIDMERKNGLVISSLSIPSYWDNFSEKEGIKNPDLHSEFEIQLHKFTEAIQNCTAPVCI